MAKATAQTRRPRANNAAALADAPRGRRVSRNGKVIKFGMARPQASGENDNELTELFGIEPFLRNQITKTDIDHLRNRIDSEGLVNVATSMEMDPMTLLRVCAGFGHRLKIQTAAKVRDYFGDTRKGRK